jgi:hypothetical protein
MVLQRLCALFCSPTLHGLDTLNAHLQAHYGQKDPAAVAKVKEVYAQLGLAAKFEAYEAESHA